MINLHLGDCLEAMRQMPDKCYDLAIVDPPYDIHKHGAQTGGKGKLKDRAFCRENMSIGINHHHKNTLIIFSESQKIK
jgi:DNA modification methylase